MPSDDDPLGPQLALARELSARWLPRRRGRRARRRLGARDVLKVMRAATDDARALAATELRFIIEELLSRGRHPSGARVTDDDLAAAGLTTERRGSAQQNVLCGGMGMARIRDLPSAHAPLRGGPPIPLFHGFDDSTRGPGDERDDAPIAERVAGRFAAASQVIPLPISGPTFSASHVRDMLRAAGIVVDNVRLEPGSWPGQADVVGLRGGLPVLSGTVALNLRVEGGHATIHAEIRLHQEDG